MFSLNLLLCVLFSLLLLPFPFLSSPSLLSCLLSFIPPHIIHSLFSLLLLPVLLPSLLYYHFFFFYSCVLLFSVSSSPLFSFLLLTCPTCLVSTFAFFLSLYSRLFFHFLTLIFLSSSIYLLSPVIFDFFQSIIFNSFLLFSVTLSPLPPTPLLNFYFPPLTSPPFNDPFTSPSFSCLSFPLSPLPPQ